MRVRSPFREALSSASGASFGSHGRTAGMMECGRSSRSARTLRTHESASVTKGLPPMSTTSQNGSSTALIHEGWNHLKSQRPLAAWGSWQRVLRADPDSVAAQQALAPSNPRRTCPWRPGPRIDSARRPIPRVGQSGMIACADQGDQDLDATADLFGRLATDDPDRFGRLVQPGPLSGLDGKEPRGDRLPGPRGRPRGASRRSTWPSTPGLWPKSSARGRSRDAGRRPAVRLHDRLETGDTSWLLESFPKSSASRRRARQASVRRASRDRGVRVARSAGVELRSSVRPAGGSAADGPGERLYQRVKRFGSRAPGSRTSNGSRRPSSRGSRTAPARSGVKRRRLPCRSSTPMSGSFGSRPVSIPTGRTSSAASRSSSTLKTSGSTAPRHGLDGRSPLAAALAASRGDAVARAKLTAVVRLREQLGNRPSALLLYQGYPFDRLRRRLGLELD